MRIRYFLIDDPTPFFEHNDAVFVPRQGDTVFIKEVFFVDRVIYYPEHNDIRVYLIDELPQKVKVAESKQSVVKLEQVNAVKKIADQALKESSSLKRQMNTVNKHLEFIERKIGKNESR